MTLTLCGHKMTLMQLADMVYDAFFLWELQKTDDHRKARSCLGND